MSGTHSIGKRRAINLKTRARDSSDTRASGEYTTHSQRPDRERLNKTRARNPHAGHNSARLSGTWLLEKNRLCRRDERRFAKKGFFAVAKRRLNGAVAFPRRPSGAHNAASNGPFSRASHPRKAQRSLQSVLILVFTPGRRFVRVLRANSTRVFGRTF